MRAVRLLAVMPVLDAADDFATGYYPETSAHFGPVTQALFKTSTADDLALARACLDAERDLRRREWGALESLLGAIPPGGDLESIFDLRTDESLAALRASVDCGWFRPGA
jgi:hypothetical protein